RFGGFGFEIGKAYEEFLLSRGGVTEPELFFFEPSEAFSTGRPLDWSKSSNFTLGSDGIDSDGFFLSAGVEGNNNGDEGSNRTVHSEIVSALLEGCTVARRARGVSPVMNGFSRLTTCAVQGMAPA